MKVLKTSLVIIYLSVLTAACGGVTNQPTQAAQQKKVESFEKVETPENYYDLFLYEAMGSCSKLDTVEFKIASSWRYAILGAKENGHPIVADLSLALMKDGTYFAEYQEVEIFQGIPDFNSGGYVTFSKHLKGTWSVSGGEITLSNLGVGKPSTFVLFEGHKPSNVIELQINESINNPNIVGKKLIIGQSISTAIPDGRSINDYCGITSKP